MCSKDEGTVRGISAIFRLKVISTKARAKLLWPFIEPILLYGLFTVVCRKVNGDILESLEHCLANDFSIVQQERNECWSKMSDNILMK